MKTKSVVTALTRALLLGSLFAFIQATTIAAEQQEVIKFGVLPVNQPETMARRFGPLIRYLEKETGYDFKLQLYPMGSRSGGYIAAVQGLITGDTPLAYLAPVTISQARHHDTNIRPVVCAVRGGSPTYVGQIAVRTDSDIQSVEDLIGRRIIGASPSSVSGNLMPSGLLIEKGINKSQFAAIDFAGGHDKAAIAVLNGEYDACWINDEIFREFRNKGAGLRAIWVHPPVPETPIAVNTHHMKPEVLSAITQALLGMHSKDLPAIHAVDPKADQWVTVDWEAYVPVKLTIDKVYGADFYVFKN